MNRLDPATVAAWLERWKIVRQQEIDELRRRWSLIRAAWHVRPAP